MAKICLDIDMSPAVLERISEGDFVNDAVEVLRVAYAGDACREAMSRSLRSDLCSDHKTARLWAEVFLRLASNEIR